MVDRSVDLYVVFFVGLVHTTLMVFVFQPLFPVPGQQFLFGFLNAQEEAFSFSFR